MEGAWESLVKTMKRALKMVTHDCPVSKEVSITFSTEIEATLNNQL